MNIASRQLQQRPETAFSGTALTKQPRGVVVSGQGRLRGSDCAALSRSQHPVNALQTGLQSTLLPVAISLLSSVACLAVLWGQ